MFRNRNCKKDTKYHEVKQLKRLIKQTSRWAVAANQDESSLIAVLHANYAVGYWWSIKDTFDDYEIDEALGGIEKRKMFEKRLLQIQENATRKASMECPQFIGKIDMLSDLAGDS